MDVRSIAGDFAANLRPGPVLEMTMSVCKGKESWEKRVDAVRTRDT